MITQLYARYYTDGADKLRTYAGLVKLQEVFMTEPARSAGKAPIVNFGVKYIIPGWIVE